MNIKINQKTLQEGLNKVEKAVTGRVTNPILEGIYISAKNGVLRLIGSDTNVTIVTDIEDVSILEEGEIIIDAKLLKEIVRKLPNEEISLRIDNDALLLKCLKTEMSLLYTDGVDYPSEIVEADGLEIILPGEKIKNMVKGTAFSTAKDTARPVLQGTLFEIENNILNMVSLDGFRLSKKSLELSQSVENVSAILDTKSFADIMKLVWDEDVIIKITPSHAIVKFGNTIATARLMEGKFVNYKSLIPTNQKLEVKVSKTDIISSLRRAEVMSNNTAPLIRISIKDAIEIQAKGNLGKVEESVEAEKNSDNDLDIAFNARYLIEALEAIDDEGIVMRFDTSISPSIITGERNITGEYLVLPVRVAA